MSVKTLGKTAGGVGGGLLVTGTYVGDGNATQAIIGVGFQPRVVRIYQQVNALNDYGVKTDKDGVNATCGGNFGANQWKYTSDMIVSLDADGFTVGDGTGASNIFNILGRVYTYIAFG